MNNYTEYLESKVYETLDDDYPQDKLLEIAKSFRTFDASLDVFIKAHGFNGDMQDIAAKTDFIKSRFDDTGVSPVPRNLKKWYTEHKRIGRITAFQICFAFRLGVEETNDFFRRICLERSFNCHCIEEAKSATTTSSGGLILAL